MSHEKITVDFDDVGMVISAGTKRLRLSRTQFKIMQVIYQNRESGKRTANNEIVKILKPGATDKALYQQMYNLRKLFNSVKFFPLRLVYIRENGDRWYEWR